MSELSKRVNEFFKSASRKDVEKVKEQIYISSYLLGVMDMFYKEHLSIDEIAFRTGYSRGKIESDLRLIRSKLKRIVEKDF